MTQTLTTRFTAFILAALIVTTAWLPTVTVPVAGIGMDPAASVA